MEGCVGTVRHCYLNVTRFEGNMFRRFVSRKNKKSKHSKVAHQDYIETKKGQFRAFLGEITDSDLAQKISINEMRQAFKRTSKKLTALYTTKESLSLPEPNQPVRARVRFVKG